MVSGCAPSPSPAVLLTLFLPQEMGQGIVHPFVWGEVGDGWFSDWSSANQMTGLPCCDDLSYFSRATSGF